MASFLIVKKQRSERKRDITVKFAISLLCPLRFSRI
jgi:hypothetical protein